MPELIAQISLSLTFEIPSPKKTSPPKFAVLNLSFIKLTSTSAGLFKICVTFELVKLQELILSGFVYE